MNLLGWIGDILLVAAVWFLAEKKRYSFLVQASGSLVWGFNGLALHMYDLIALNIVFIALSLRAWWKWGK